MKIEFDKDAGNLIAQIFPRQDDNKPPAPQDLGKLGLVFGGRYANTNLTGLVIVAAVLLILVVVVRSETSTYSREIITGMVSLISLSLGYLFGSARGR